MPREQAHDHDHYSHKEHEQGNTVHPVHEAYVDIFGIIGVPLTDIEVSKDLLPDTLFHDGIHFY